MSDSLFKYNNKRNFNKTSEPKGTKRKASKKVKTKKLIFCVQHHASRRDHYDFRLELNGVLLSWAIPKGPSYNPEDKRLAVHVEDHPYSYRNFEGVIPQGEYGGGVVQLWDKGTWLPLEEPNKTYKEGYLKFELKGTRLKGVWTLIHFKENNWLLIKEKDNIKVFSNITKYKTSIKTNRTISEIKQNIKAKKLKSKEPNKINIENITITSPDKIMYKKPKITKLDVIKYYQIVGKHMLPYLQNRLISTKRCPNGIEGNIFFKKHLETESKGIKMLKLPSSKDKKDDYYYITNLEGLISEVQMNSIEFHIWGSKVSKLNEPDMIVFDLDPDENMNIKKVREGVKDLKNVLDELNLKSYLKTSGGKGYHVVVPIKTKMNWEECKSISKNIAKLMETKWPDKYTSNIRKQNRKGKIFIDWVRNTKGATSIAPYSLRARPNAPVSMPISWDELDIIKPNEITLSLALKRLKSKNYKDPWKKFFT